MKVVPIHGNEAIVKKARLAELERKEQAHDAYLRATQRMRMRQQDVLHLAVDPQGTAVGRARAEGWLAAMGEFAEEVRTA